MCSKMETCSQKLQTLLTFTAPFSDDDPPIMSLRASAILPPAPRPAHNLLNCVTVEALKRKRNSAVAPKMVRN